MTVRSRLTAAAAACESCRGAARPEDVLARTYIGPLARRAPAKLGASAAPPTARLSFARKRLILRRHQPPSSRSRARTTGPIIMTVARFPSLAHWGAFTALVENGRLVGCEPFARDPAPSDMLEVDARRWCIRRCASPGRRSARAGARASRAPAATRFHEVSWDEALRHGRRRTCTRARAITATRRSSAAPTAGRRPAACTTRAAWCGGSCSSAAAASTRSATTASARRNISCRASSAPSSRLSARSPTGRRSSSTPG